MTQPAPATLTVAERRTILDGVFAGGRTGAGETDEAVELLVSGGCQLADIV
jgi:hypothetical protein